MRQWLWLLVFAFVFPALSSFAAGGSTTTPSSSSILPISGLAPSQCVTNHTQIQPPSRGTGIFGGPNYYGDFNTPQYGGKLCPGQYSMSAYCTASTPSSCGGSSCGYQTALVNAASNSPYSFSTAVEASCFTTHNNPCENLSYVYIYLSNFTLDTGVTGQNNNTMYFQIGGTKWSEVIPIQCSITAVQTKAY